MLCFFLVAPAAAMILLNLPFGAWLRKTAFSLAVVVCLAQIALAFQQGAAVWMPVGPLDFCRHLHLYADGLSRVLRRMGWG